MLVFLSDELYLLEKILHLSNMDMVAAYQKCMNLCIAWKIFLYGQLLSVLILLDKVCYCGAVCSPINCLLHCLCSNCVNNCFTTVRL